MFVGNYLRRELSDVLVSVCVSPNRIISFCGVIVMICTTLVNTGTHGQLLTSWTISSAS